MNKGVEQIVSWSAVIDGVLSFIAVQDGEYYFRESIAEFKDINDHWAKEYIEFTHTHELFKGVGNGLFNPDGKMTRAMFVTVLGRLHGVDPGMYGASSLNDVKNGQWYSPFVEWAYRNNIVLGDGKGSFNPDMGITRQEMRDTGTLHKIRRQPTKRWIRKISMTRTKSAAGPCLPTSFGENRPDEGNNNLQPRDFTTGQRWQRYSKTLF